jgi:hypothetical protein
MTLPAFRSRLVFALLAAAAALPLALAALVLDGKSDVAAADSVKLADVQHAIAVLRAHDPRRALPGQLTAARLNESDLALLLNHGAHRAFGGRAEVRLAPGVATLHLSQPLPLLPGAGRLWLNASAELGQGQGLPQLASLRIGRLPLPTALAGPLVRRALAHGGVDPSLLELRDTIDQVAFGQDTLTVAYRWQADTTARLLSALTPAAERERLRAYSDLLVRLAEAHVQATGGAAPIALPALIGPAFRLARERSATAGSDPVHENRAAILTLALYTTGRGVAALVPAAHDWPRPYRLPVVLAGRDDFPMHFMISAALAMEGTSPLVNAIGLAKEVADSRHGSGFSFNDLAANKAGLRFGQMALAEPEALQHKLAAGVAESSLMPDVQDLPEFLSASEFAARFGGVGAPPYQRVLADIEKRIGGLTLYR